jgi:hypothetical protein
MDVRETDIDFPQSTDLVDYQLDGIAGGIVDLLSDDNPDSSGVVEPNHETEVIEEVKEEVAEEETEEATEETEAVEDKYTIKWEGQEKEVTQKELFEFAQKGFDYTQKTQALARERDELAPYVGLAKAIKSDPALAAEIAAKLSGQPVTPPEKTTFDDPLEEFEHKVYQKVMRDVETKLSQNITPLARQQAIDRFKVQVQSLPDYNEIHPLIVKMVQDAPPALQKDLYTRLDQDPDSYMQTYNHFKKLRGDTSVTKSAPKPVKKETKAPIVEAGGLAPATDISRKERQESLTKKKAKALRSGDNMAIADWLVDSGALEHLY